MREQFTEEQRRNFVRLVDADRAKLTTKAACQKHGCKEANYHSWKRKLENVETDETSQLRVENAKLRKLLADKLIEGMLAQV